MLEEPREERDVSMNAYVRKQAGKEIIRHYLERMGEAMPDPVPYAREMFSRKVVSKLTLELAEPSDLPIENRSTSFISSMYSAIERDYRNFYQFLEVLRMWPNTVAIADVVEKAYNDLLDKWNLEQYLTLPPILPTLDKGVQAFSRISLLQEQLWDAAEEFVRKKLSYDVFNKFMMYTIIDAREEVKAADSMERLFEIAQTKIDVTNVVLIESLAYENRAEDLIQQLTTYNRERQYFYHGFLLKHYAFLLDQPGYTCARPDTLEPIMLRVKWNLETITFAEYMNMMEGAFSSLTNHMYLHRIDRKKNELHYYCSNWITLALAKLARERGSTLRVYDVSVVTVGLETAVLDPTWGITDEDTFEFMENMLKVMKGKIDEVHEDIEGVTSRKKKEALQHGVLKFTPPDYSVPHVIFRLTDFSNHVHLNDLWISHPFYSGHPGYKMCICVNANGVGMGRGTHISTCVCLMKGEYDDQLAWPFRGRVTIRMRNQLTSMMHIVGMFEFDEFIRQDACARVTGPSDYAPVGLGNHLFASHSDLEYDVTRNRQYLKNDCVELEVCDVKIGLSD